MRLTTSIVALTPCAVLSCLILAGCDRPPAAKAKLDCTVAPVAPIPPGPPFTADNTMTGGTLLASSFEVPVNVNVTLDKDLVVMTTGNITIAGAILNGPRILGARSINILLVSLQGDIMVWEDGVVGSGAAADGATRTDKGLLAYAKGGPGQHGGWIKMVAALESIAITGTVLGNAGGNGGDAIADATLAANPGIAPWLAIPWLASASAYGGDAGEGGDVFLCAREIIRLLTPPPPPPAAPGGGVAAPVGGRVFGGPGGRGGATMAAAENAPAFARSGSQKGQGTGGFVYVDFAAPGGGPVPVSIDRLASIKGGNGAQPGPANAQASSQAAPALAEGGAGGPGGEVVFGRAVVTNLGTIESGNGGRGGAANAVGGDGIAGVAAANGGHGGDATARGGPGAPPGRPPAYLDGTANPWRMTLGSVGSQGPGGPADATGGRGGNAGPAGQLGGNSGTGTAIGGTGLVPGLVATTQTFNPATNAAGEAGTTAQQPGNP
jgi:hypothetical protein